MFCTVTSRSTPTPTWHTPRSTSVTLSATFGLKTSARQFTTLMRPPPASTINTPRYPPSSLGLRVHSTSASPCGPRTPSAMLNRISSAPGVSFRTSRRRHDAATADALRSVSIASPATPRWRRPKSTADCATTTSGPSTSAVTRTGSAGPCSHTHVSVRSQRVTSSAVSSTTHVAVSPGRNSPLVGYTRTVSSAPLSFRSALASSWPSHRNAHVASEWFVTRTSRS